LSLQGGVILATGPTGSGKTTTLYSALKKLTTPGVKTITVEDPVEYRLSGMLQVQVNRAANFDFAAALRAILRADPDVLLVGEIRDPETARTAMGAALTGQVVLASLHASTAATAPLRLVDLGIEPFMASAAVRGVINQRLLRRLCRQCRTPYVPRLSNLDDAQWPFERPERLWGPRSGGCEACFGTGYKGRAVVAEVIKMNDDIRSAVVNRAEPALIEILAISSGMVPIRHDALQLARQGATSLEEVARVLGDS
jgi:type II secretory ATPase GspE/PulE/Tfp pilus assembly ATPase PilB-like protein